MNAKQSESEIGVSSTNEPVDEVDWLLDRLAERLRTVDGRLDEATKLLDDLDVVDAEIVRLVSAPNEGHVANKDLTVEGAQERRKAELGRLNMAIQQLCQEAADCVVVAHSLAASERNFALFYIGPSPVVFVQSSNSNEVASKARTLGAITHVAISNADAAREVNRLLDHASSKRIAEEMDIVTYQAQAARSFERIRTEFSDVSRDFERRAKKMDELGLTLDTEPSRSQRLRSIAGRCSKVDGLPDNVRPSDSADRFDAACNWLSRYGKFLKYSKACADRMANDFASEASVEVYRDATRPHAKRIEQQGLLLVSKQTLGMALAAAVIVALILIFINNNLVMKNWVLALVGLSAAVMYILAIKFGHAATGGHMQDLRNTLLARALDILNPFGATAVSEALTEEYFQFPKIGWERFQAADATAKPQVPGGVLAKTFDDVSSRKWFLRRRRMVLSNAGALASMVALLLALSWMSGSPVGRGTFAFISQTAEHGACELDRGHLLLATGGNYYLVSSHGNRVTEVAKSLVWQIKPVNPGESDRTAAAGDFKENPPDCATLAIGPTAISFASPLALDQDQTALAGAAGVIASSIDEGLESIATKLIQSRAPFAECGPKCVTALTEFAKSTDRVAGNILSLRETLDKMPSAPAPRCVVGACQPIEVSVTPAPLPVVVPVAVEVQSQQIPVEGPTFVTQFHVVDGLISDHSGGRLIVLPLFPGPVTGDKAPVDYGSDGINTPQEAYYFGLTSMANPRLPGEDRTLLDYIQSSVKRCMDATQAAFENKGDLGDAPRLRLSVRGYANEKWTAASVSAERREILNWYLAEGRRQAVINALGIADHGLIEIVPAGAAALSFEGPAEVDLKKVVRRFQFDGPVSMKRSLEHWLVPPVSENDKRYVKEIFAKSVVIEIESDALDHCGGTERRSVVQR